MKNRIASFFPKKTETTIECPYCHESKVRIPHDEKEPTLCSVCDARFTVETCPERNFRCGGHISAEPSPELIKAIEEWRDAHRARVRDQHENPENWTLCWKGDCNDGVEMRLTRLGAVPVGLCDECSGTGKILRA